MVFRVFGNKMAKIGPIGLKIGFLINRDLSNGQNKNEVPMYKFVAKNSIVWPKIGQLPIWRTDFQWASLGHFCSILKFLGSKIMHFFKKNRMALRSKLYLLYIKFSYFGPHFCLHGLYWTYGSKTTL